MKKIVITTAVIFFTITAHCQVKGSLTDSATLKPIENAVVAMVVKANATDTVYTFTNEKGQFKFDIIPTSNFSIIIRHLSYKPVAKFIPVTKVEKTIDVGAFVLTYDAQLLDEVKVETAAIVIKEDTVEYNAGSFTVKEGAVVEELVKKLPGIQVDKDGNITAQGKSVSRVKVNGKDFFGGDVKTATRELPANIVDKIQIIDDYGDQATVSGIKDGEPDKVMNIQLKKDKNRGFFGRATAGYGTQKRYLGSFNGNYFNNDRQISVLANSNNTNTSLFNFSGGDNRGATSMMRSGMNVLSNAGGMGGLSGFDPSAFSGGNSNGISTANSFGFNYRDKWGKKISAYGSYSYNHKNTDQLQISSSQRFFENSSFVNNQDVNNITIGNTHRFTLNIEFQIDSFNYLKISPSINFSESDANNKTIFGNTDNGGNKTSDGSNKSVTESKAPNVAATILYNHKFKKYGRNFSSSITLGNSKNNFEQDVFNLSTQYIPFPRAFNIFQFINQQNNNHNYGVRFTYAEPLSKTRSLDLSFSHNLNYSRNNRATYNVDSATQAQTINSILSNNYENNFYNNRIGVSIRTTQKKYNYTLGLSLQPINLQGNSITKDSAYKTIKRVNLFPVARFTYNFSRTKTFNFNYTGNATQPSFSQLQPVLDVSNQQSITSGNPNLKPSVSNSLNFSYNNFNFISGKVLFTNLNVSSIKNQIVYNTISSGGGQQLRLPENVNGYYNVMGFYTISKPYKNRKYVLSLRGNANFNNNINLIDSIKSVGKNWIASQGFNFEYNYKQIVEFGVGVAYSINDVKYKSKSGKPLTLLQNSSSNAWVFSSNINLNITKFLVLRYDVDYTVNNGLANNISQNQAIMNASIEQQLFKKKNGIFKIEAFDLFKQNTNINRSVLANAITDSRTNRLTRYFIASFTYRLQKFVGQKKQGVNFGGMGGPPPPGF